MTARIPSADVKTFVASDFRLQSGIVMPSVTIAYRTLGVLAPNRDNVVLVTHGNTSGPQLIDPGGSTGEGSWNEIVGPGKAVDTNRFFVICANVVGGCMGTTGPSDIDPATAEPYGPKFPVVTIRDMVRAQAMLLALRDVLPLVANKVLQRSRDLYDQVAVPN